VPDAFLDIFLRELEVKLGKVGPLLEKRGDVDVIKDVANSYKLWQEVGECCVEERVVAVDGGIGSIRLANGHEVVVARAAAVSSNGPTARDLVVDILPLESPDIKRAYLMMVESELASEVLEEYSGVKYLLLDGSYYARIISILHNLILTREFVDLFYIPELTISLYSISNLIEKARSKGVKLVFVSKDSRFRMLKEHVLFSYLMDVAPNDVVRKGLALYSVLWLKKYRRELRNLLRRGRIAHIVELILRFSITDQTFVDRMAKILGVDRGYTIPLYVGLVDAYVNEKGLNSVDAIVRASSRRIEDSLMFRRGEKIDDYESMVEKAVRRLPKALLTYVKPSADDSPMLVEELVLDQPLLDGNAVKGFMPTAEVEDVICLLLCHYKTSIHYNTWLWLAHTYAKLKGSSLAEYAVYVRKKLKDLGLEHLTGRGTRLGLGV